MNVVHVTPFFPPHEGGIERHVYFLTKALAEEGLDVKIYTSNVYHGYKNRWFVPSTTYANREIINGVQVLRSTPIWLPLRNPLMPDLFFQLFRERPDIIHTHDYFFNTTNVACLCSMIKKSPLVLTYHTTDIQFRSFGVDFVRQLYDRSAGSLLLRNSRKIITVNSIIHKRLVAQGVNPNKIVTIPNGISFDEFELDMSEYNKSAYRHKLGVADDESMILFVGRLIEWKGVEYLIRALSLIKKDIPSIKLVIVGEGPIRNELMELTRKIGVTKSVVFVGQIPHAQIPKVIHSADVCVLPSIHDGQRILLEFMACKKPVVATSVGSIPEIITSQSGVLVEPKSEASLAEGLLRVLTDNRFSCQIATRAKEYVKRKFDLKQMVKKTIAIYKDLIPECAW